MMNKLFKDGYLINSNRRGFIKGSTLKISKKCLAILTNAAKRVNKANGINIPPYLAILGENNDGVVVSVHFLSYNRDGCFYMGDITPADFSKGIFKLAKKGLTPCAILRMMQKTRIDGIEQYSDYYRSSLGHQYCRDKYEKFNLGNLIEQNPNFRSISIYGKNMNTMIVESYTRYSFYYHNWEVV